MLLHDDGIIQVAPIDDNRIAQRLMQTRQVQLSKLFPVRENKQGIGVSRSRVGIDGIAENGARRQHVLCAIHGSGIVGRDVAALGDEHFYQLDRR